MSRPENYSKNMAHLRSLKETIAERLNEQLARAHPELAGRNIFYFTPTVAAEGEDERNHVFHIIIIDKDCSAEMAGNPAYSQTITHMMETLLSTDLLRARRKYIDPVHTDPPDWPQEKHGMLRHVRFGTADPAKGLEAINSMLDPDLRLRDDVVHYTSDNGPRPTAEENAKRDSNAR